MTPACQCRRLGGGYVNESEDGKQLLWSHRGPSCSAFEKGRSEMACCAICATAVKVAMVYLRHWHRKCLWGYSSDSDSSFSTVA